MQWWLILPGKGALREWRGATQAPYVQHVLQGGLVDSSTCPPEGGRHIDPKRLPHSLFERLLQIVLPMCHQTGGLRVKKCPQLVTAGRMSQPIQPMSENEAASSINKQKT